MSKCVKCQKTDEHKTYLNPIFTTYLPFIVCWFLLLTLIGTSVSFSYIYECYTRKKYDILFDRSAEGILLNGCFLTENVDLWEIICTGVQYYRLCFLTQWEIVKFGSSAGKN